MFSSISDFFQGGCAGCPFFLVIPEFKALSNIDFASAGFQPEQGAFLNLPDKPLRFGDVDQNREHRKFGTQKARSGIKQNSSTRQ
jgi:hypothetical protein